MTTPHLSPMGQAALTCLGRFAVLPCCWPDAQGNCACGRNPPHEGRDIGKAPLMPHGLTEATQLTSGVINYWRRWPKANIGIAIPKGKFVLDVDIDKGGYESLGRLQHDYDTLPETWLVTTGSLGQHYWYSSPIEIRNSPALTDQGYKGLDIKGSGGYVIGPPSLHRCGGRYKVSDIWSGPIMAAPAWLVELLTQKRHMAQSPNASTDSPIPEGARNDTLVRDAGAMRRRGLSEEAIFAALKIENMQRCQPPLPDDEVLRIAKSVGRYVPQAPVTKETPHGFRGGVRV